MSHFESRRWEDFSIPIKILIIVGGVAAAIGFFFLIGFVVMALWNWLMPEIFKLPTIDFWKAWGILILSSILFKGGAGGGGRRHDNKRRRELRKRMKDFDAVPVNNSRESGASDFGESPREV